MHARSTLATEAEFLGRHIFNEVDIVFLDARSRYGAAILISIIIYAKYRHEDINWDREAYIRHKNVKGSIWIP